MKTVVKGKGYIEIDQERCKGCGMCIDACPYDLIKFSSKFNSKGYHPAEYDDPEGICPPCGFCYRVCPDTAITVFRIVR